MRLSLFLIGTVLVACVPLGLTEKGRQQEHLQVVEDDPKLDALLDEVADYGDWMKGRFKSGNFNTAGDLKTLMQWARGVDGAADASALIVVKKIIEFGLGKLIEHWLSKVAAMGQVYELAVPLRDIRTTASKTFRNPDLAWPDNNVNWEANKNAVGFRYCWNHLDKYIEFAEKLASIFLPSQYDEQGVECFTQVAPVVFAYATELQGWMNMYRTDSKLGGTLVGDKLCGDEWGPIYAPSMLNILMFQVREAAEVKKTDNGFMNWVRKKAGATDCPPSIINQLPKMSLDD